ncbi:hypothetical protein WDM69_08735 [Moraxella lincolnii]|uniref:hypothetical protein n=1 Tax=Lwoffella lincolnii TaxID=90241 RepID=UPI0030CC0554
MLVNTSPLLVNQIVSQPNRFPKFYLQNLLLCHLWQLRQFYQHSILSAPKHHHTPLDFHVNLR